MTRFLMIVAVVGAAALAPVPLARADEKPTPEQMEQAKAAYQEGRALHDQGKLPEAVEKFKESYRLSKRPQLLYNIALTMDEAKQELALFYYQKYLTDAPKDDKFRSAATDRVKALEAAALAGGTTAAGSGSAEGSAAPPTDAQKPVDTTTQPKPPVETAPVKVKPPGTYHAEDFQHQVVEEAPPGKPLDITASVPPDSGWTVTLFYRAAGESKWNPKPMKWRYKELIARIPAAEMKGSAIQYYVEAKESNGEVVTRAGKPTSPNLINIDDKATPKFYPDLQDDGAPAVAVVEQRHSDDDNPLGKGGENPLSHDKDEPIGGPQQHDTGTPGQGFRDPGSKSFERVKWISTGVAAGFLGLAAFSYVEAGKQASALQLDISTDKDGHPCQAPCRPFDTFDADLQSAGKRYQTFANVGFVVGVAATAVAGYWWYRELTHKKAPAETPGATGGSPETRATWFLAPAAGDGFAGATAVGSF